MVTDIASALEIESFVIDRIKTKQDYTNDSFGNTLTAISKNLSREKTSYSNDFEMQGNSNEAERSMQRSEQTTNAVEDKSIVNKAAENDRKENNEKVTDQDVVSAESSNNDKVPDSETKSVNDNPNKIDGSEEDSINKEAITDVKNPLVPLALSETNTAVGTKKTDGSFVLISGNMTTPTDIKIENLREIISPNSSQEGELKGLVEKNPQNINQLRNTPDQILEKNKDILGVLSNDLNKNQKINKTSEPLNIVNNPSGLSQEKLLNPILSKEGDGMMFDKGNKNENISLLKVLESDSQTMDTLNVQIKNNESISAQANSSQNLLNIVSQEKNSVKNIPEDSLSMSVETNESSKILNSKLPQEKTSIQQSFSTSYTDKLGKDIIDQVKSSITPDKTKIDLILKPESLGKLNIQLVAEKGTIAAHITADNILAKDLLEKNLASLKQTMIDKGINLDKIHIQISTTTNNTQHQHNEYNPSNMNHWYGGHSQGQDRENAPNSTDEEISQDFDKSSESSLTFQDESQNLVSSHSITYKTIDFRA